MGGGEGVWRFRGGQVGLGRAVVMGVLNVTPDSFSDGGRYQAPEAALAHAEALLAAGADLLDVGGESTRPGADEVSGEEELARVLPVLRLLKARLAAPVSVDTRRAAVAHAALAEGAAIINDVSALGDREMPGVVASAGAGVVLMHMRGTPRTMQRQAHYADVVGEVAQELAAARARALAAGIAPECIVLDPGIGFAKTAEHNWRLLGRLEVLAALGSPLLLGVSRKAFLGALLDGAPPEQRVGATAAACVAGYLAGARVFRVHDVREVREALRVAEAVQRAREGGP